MSPTARGCYPKIIAAERLIDKEKVEAAIHLLNAFAYQLEAASYDATFNDIVDDVLDAIDQVIEDLLAPAPGELVMWYVDMDQDGLTVPVGRYYTGPFEGATTSIGRGVDYDDNDPNSSGQTEWNP